jgi:hypothetical protein
MSKTFKGRTEDADAIFLSADFWRAGARLAGKVVRCFETANGNCYVIDLLTPIELDGEIQERVTLGNLTGFRMALQAAGLERLLSGDVIHVECTSSKVTTKGSPRPNFELEITRS